MSTNSTPLPTMTADEAATFAAILRGELVLHRKSGKPYGRHPSWSPRPYTSTRDGAVWIPLVGSRNGKPFGPVRDLRLATLAATPKAEG